VVGLDISPRYLELARKAGRERPSASVAASIDRIPFADRTFDVVWSAQSLFSLPEPIDAVARMARIIKQGGIVAILEDDRLHWVLLPWSVEIELAVRTIEWDNFRKKIRSFATTRIAPLEGPAWIRAASR
jgi:ubiquinone/menaquinone biosynthesis C-methylase UbiE